MFPEKSFHHHQIAINPPACASHTIRPISWPVSAWKTTQKTIESFLSFSSSLFRKCVDAHTQKRSASSDIIFIIPENFSVFGERQRARFKKRKMFFDLLTRRSDKNRIGWRKSVCVGCVSVCCPGV